MKAFALIVGRKGTTAVRTFIPLEAKPFQIINHGAHELGPGAHAIEIFVAQHQHTIVFARALLRRPERASVSEMQMGGGRGGQAPAIRPLLYCSEAVVGASPAMRGRRPIHVL